MKICIPTITDEIKTGRVNEHFGSAPYFTVNDTETDLYEIINNPNREHLHGTCNPAEVLINKNVNAVICKGMGSRAITKLNQAGIEVYITDAETVDEVIKNFKNNKLEKNFIRRCLQKT